VYNPLVTMNSKRKTLKTVVPITSKDSASVQEVYGIEQFAV
jgi:hypothetical protein